MMLSLSCGQSACDLDALPQEEPSGASLGFPVFPTNILFWGTHDEVTNAGLTTPPPPVASASAAAASSSPSGRRKENLVIDTPTRPVALSTLPMNSPLSASQMPGTADKMRSPVSARLRRLLSRGKQAMVGTSYSPRDAGDIEQGLVEAQSSRPPKTQKMPPSTNCSRSPNMAWLWR